MYTNMQMKEQDTRTRECSPLSIVKEKHKKEDIEKKIFDPSNHKPKATTNGFGTIYMDAIT